LLRGYLDTPTRADRARFYTPQVEADVKDLSAQGWGNRRIADHLGCSVATVHDLLKGRNNRTPSRPPSLPDGALDVFRQNGTVDAVAALAGCRAGTAVRLLEEAGVQVPADQTPQGRRVAAITLYRSGKSINQVAAAIGRSRSWTYNVLDQAHVLRPGNRKRGAPATTGPAGTSAGRPDDLVRAPSASPAPPQQPPPLSHPSSRR
jgi:transposase